MIIRVKRTIPHKCLKILINKTENLTKERMDIKMSKTTLIITILLLICTVTTSAAWSTYAASKVLERDYAFLESRYAQLYTQSMTAELTTLNLPDWIVED